MMSNEADYWGGGRSGHGAGIVRGVGTARLTDSSWNVDNFVWLVGGEWFLGSRAAQRKCEVHRKYSR